MTERWVENVDEKWTLDVSHTHAGTDCFDPDCPVTQGGVPTYVGSGLEPHSHCPSCGGRLWPKQQTFVECEDCGLRYPMSKPKAQGGVPTDLDRMLERWEGIIEPRPSFKSDLINRLIEEREKRQVIQLPMEPTVSGDFFRAFAHAWRERPWRAR